MNPKSKIKYKTGSTKTVSGLQAAGLITNIISAFTWIFIFLVEPYVVNKFGNPTLSALINVFPTGVLVALFIKEEEFGPFYNKLLFAPIFNIFIFI